MESEGESSLLLFQNGPTSSLPLGYNKNNRNKLWKALQILILKPHVVDRRILSRWIFSQRVMNRSKVRGNGSSLVIDVEEMFPECASNRVGEAITDLDDFDEEQVLLLLAKVLPRQSEHMRPCHELILADFRSTEVFFIRLDSGSESPCFPGDINKSWSYKVSFEPRKQEIEISLSPFYEISHPVQALPDFTPPTQKWLFDTLLPKLVKWTNEVNPEGLISARRSIISISRYSDVREHLKKTYADKFIKGWTENTDPQKFVYEDISIAAFLIVLWEEETERLQLGKKQSFVDLGCGNGLLVHILNAEGYPGKGIDLRKRKIWAMYGPETNLEEHTIIPGDLNGIQGYDWLIGNHSDELTPWIPVMAFRSSENTRYFVLPCCFHDFDRKFTKTEGKETQYRSYLNFILEVGRVCGYEVQEDCMRIPSTKRICQVGLKSQKLPQSRSELEKDIQDYIEERRLLSRLESVKFETDQEFGALRGSYLTSSVLEKEQQWMTNFEPRPKEESVRNCSKLDESLKERIVNEVFKAVMDAGKTKEEQEVKRMKTEVKWDKGGVITISETARLFDGVVLKQLKSECGGLKTLLKNSYPVFLLIGDTVQLRDWTDLERSLPQSTSKNRAKEQAKREGKFKTKLCWFYLNHPDSCPRNMAECPFAHGDGDLRIFTSEYS